MNRPPVLYEPIHYLRLLYLSLLVISLLRKNDQNMPAKICQLSPLQLRPGCAIYGTQLKNRNLPKIEIHKNKQPSECKSANRMRVKMVGPAGLEPAT